MFKDFIVVRGGVLDTAPPTTLGVFVAEICQQYPSFINSRLRLAEIVVRSLDQCLVDALFE